MTNRADIATDNRETAEDAERRRFTEIVTTADGRRCYVAKGSRAPAAIPLVPPEWRDAAGRDGPTVGLDGEPLK